MTDWVTWSTSCIPAKTLGCEDVSCLLFRLKFRSTSGASHHPTLTGNCQTISHTYYGINDLFILLMIYFNFGLRQIVHKIQSIK